MLRTTAIAIVASLSATISQAGELGYLLCEYSALGEDERWKSQSIPMYYVDDKLVALGNPSHCLDEPQFTITERHAAWRCVNAKNENGSASRSIYVEINRYTGRYHRNDFDGHYDDLNIRDVWHGVCSAHHEPQF